MSSKCIRSSDRLRFRLLLVLAFMMIAQTAHCGELNETRKEQELLTAHPQSTIEVLRNFKLALDNDLFLQNDFYANENLRTFFTATSISWDLISPFRQTGRMISKYSVGLYVSFGSIDSQGNDVETGRKQAGGILTGNLTADLIMTMFGKPENVTNPHAEESPVHPSPVMPKTHDLGNLAIEYKFDRPKTTASLYCLFNGDGTVNRCNFGNAEK